MASERPVGTRALRVFISYSWQDIQFVDKLVTALDSRGFEVLIDRRSLPEFEQWKPELADLIRQSDTVIFVASPNSVASKMCAWELEQVTLCEKRLAPVKIAQNLANTPEIVSSIQSTIDFADPFEGIAFDNQAEKLARALNTDAAWIKEHTSVADQAHRWLTQKRSVEFLLHGKNVQNAIDWATSRPIEAPKVTNEQINYIMMSKFGARGLINFFGIFGWLSFITGLLSLVALIQHGFKLGSFIAPFQVVIDAYEVVIHNLLGVWAEPIIKWVISQVQPFLHIHLMLDPGWKHAFVLMMVFFSSFSRQTAGASRKTAIFTWIAGITISLLLGIFIGLFPPPIESSDPWYVLLNMLIPLAPLIMVGIFFIAGAIWYSVILARIQQTTWTEEFTNRPTFPLVVLFAIFAGLISTLWLVGVIGDFKSDVLAFLPLLALPRPAVIGIGFVVVVIIFLSWAALASITYARRYSTTWLYEFKAHFWTSVALSMILVMFAAALVLAINAGAKLFWGIDHAQRMS